MPVVLFGKGEDVADGDHVDIVMDEDVLFLGGSRQERYPGSREILIRVLVVFRAGFEDEGDVVGFGDDAGWDVARFL